MGSKLITSVYPKPTFTGQYLNWKSFSPRKRKLCMNKWNRLTPVRRRLSLTQPARDKPISTGLAPVSEAKARSLEAISQ